MRDFLHCSHQFPSHVLSPRSHFYAVCPFAHARPVKNANVIVHIWSLSIDVLLRISDTVLMRILVRSLVVIITVFIKCTWIIILEEGGFFSH